jgi:pimeloyl-ACP methyl ester carboxylesterase
MQDEYDFPKEAICPMTTLPVILVPGVMSTQLQANGHDIWLNPLDVVTKKVFTDLALQEDGKTPVADVTITTNNANFGLKGISNLLPLMKLSATAVYEDMIKALTEQGYYAGQTLFGFPYDWRLDVRTCSEQLYQLIQTVLQQTGAPQVQLVAHSMGGLVVKDMLLTKEGIASQVSLLITLGTPYLGAAKPTKALALGGDSFGFPLFTDQDMYEIERNAPAVYQLAPSTVYDDVYGRTMCTITENGQTVNANTRYVNQSLWQQAVERHAGWDTHNNDQIEQVHYVGQTISKINATVIGVTAELVEGQPPVVQYQMGPGDGTVPHLSATHPGTENATVITVQAKSHQEMLSEPAIIASVIKRLQQQDVEEETLSEEALLEASNTEGVGHVYVLGGERDQFAHLEIVLTDTKTGIEQNMKFELGGRVHTSHIPTELYTVAEVSGYVDIQFFLRDADGYKLTVKGRKPAELHTYHYRTGPGITPSIGEVHAISFTLDKCFCITG